MSSADALTAELADWAACCRTGATPRVDGRTAVAALELADWVLEEIAAGAAKQVAPLRVAA